MGGAILGAIIAGALIGAIPAICGAIKQKMGLAIGGFLLVWDPLCSWG